MEIGGAIDREWVLKHLTIYLDDEDASEHRTRLMWTLLSVCGKPEDAALYRSLVDAGKDADPSIGFDAALGCYVCLVGEEGLRELTSQFLNSDDNDRVLSGLNAVRFHAVETKLFPPDVLSKTLHPLINKPELAAYVVPDLARMNDWRPAERLVELFGKEEFAVVRVPIVNYLRACPLPEAKAMVEVCRGKDASAVRRSEIMFGHIKPATQQ